jgi:hypothetical protein
VVIDAREAEVGERQAAEARDRVVGSEVSRSHVVEQLAEGGFVHGR